MKVLQIVYSCSLRSSLDLVGAENELIMSMKKTYDLYHYLLLLIVVLTDAEQKRIDKKRHKYLASQEDRDPNTRLANNRLAEQLRTNLQLHKFSNEKGFLWDEDDSAFVKNLLNKILASETYTEYLESDDCYESDSVFWQRIFRAVILNDDEISEFLEDKCIYWEDDLMVTGSFVIKTLKQIFKEDTDSYRDLLPMFAHEEDRQFALTLLSRSIMEKDENTARIESQIKNWDVERLAMMDLFIMQIAITEMRNFPSIPIGVTLNEYIDLAHYYSSPKSSVFINGILDSIAKDMQKEGLIFKTAN